MDRVGAELSHSLSAPAHDTNTGSGEYLLTCDPARATMAPWNTSARGQRPSGTLVWVVYTSAADGL